MVDSPSPLFDADYWRAVEGCEDFTDVTYHRSADEGVVRIAFNRPDVRNAFRPRTVDELYRALDHARLSSTVGAVILTGNGPSSRDGGWSFSSGGDQRVRGKDGYQYSSTDDASGVDPTRSGRLHILEVQRLIRFMPKVVIAAIPGWAAGGGHSLHVVCDLSMLAPSTHDSSKPMLMWDLSMVVTAVPISPNRWDRSLPGRSSSWGGNTTPPGPSKWVR